MSNYATLKSAIQSVIKTNGNQEITGAILQSTLLSIVDSIGADYLFAGVATPQTNAGAPDQNVFYVGGAGTYTNFGSSYTVPVGSIGVFAYNGSWSRSSVSVWNMDTFSRHASVSPAGKIDIDTVNKIITMPSCNITHGKIGFILQAQSISFSGETADARKVVYNLDTSSISQVSRNTDIGDDSIVLFTFVQSSGITDLPVTCYTINGQSPIGQDLALLSRSGDVYVPNLNYINFDTVNQVVTIPASGINVAYGKVGLTIGAQTCDYSAMTADALKLIYNVTTSTLSVVSRNTDIGNDSIVLAIFGRQSGKADLPPTMYTINGKPPIFSTDDLKLVSRKASIYVPSGSYIDIDTQNNIITIPAIGINVAYGKVGLIIGTQTYDYSTMTADALKCIYNVTTSTLSVVSRNTDIGDDSIVLFFFGKSSGLSDLPFPMYTINGSSMYKEYRDINRLRVLAIGDSICKAVRNSGKSYLAYITTQYSNNGVSYSTISNKVTDHTNIPDQLIGATYSNPDIILAEGGINDYIRGAALGNIPTSAVNTDTDANALDRDTVCGAMAFLCYKMIKLYPNAQRFFILVHRMLDYPWTPNSQGYTQTDLFDALRAICNLYNVKVIDIFNDSFINSRFDEYMSDTNLDGNTGPLNTTDYINLDGIHPLDRGYKEGYAPIIKESIKTAIKR